MQIFQTDGIKCIEYCDTPDTLFYIDPPYPHETRTKLSLKEYSHEMTNDQHKSLVDILCRIKGSAVISSYPNDIYSPLLEYGYRKIDILTSCNAAVRSRGSGLQGVGSAIAKAPRTEVIWYRYTTPTMTGGIPIITQDNLDFA